MFWGDFWHVGWRVWVFYIYSIRLFIYKMYYKYVPNKGKYVISAQMGWFDYFRIFLKFSHTQQSLKFTVSKTSIEMQLCGQQWLLNEMSNEPKGRDPKVRLTKSNQITTLYNCAEQTLRTQNTGVDVCECMFMTF